MGLIFFAFEKFFYQAVMSRYIAVNIVIKAIVSKAAWDSKIVAKYNQRALRITK